MRGDLKQTIRWHKDGLAASRQWLAVREAELEDLAKSVTLYRQSLEFLAKQIQEAERLGKDGFDAERFMRPRGN